MIKFKPLGNNLLIEHAVVTKSASGLELPESAWAFKEDVEVYAKGAAVKEVSIGDKVKLNPNRHATEVTLDGVKYLLVNEHDLLGIITKHSELN